MAEEFLRQLLQVHNRVESDEGQTCVICMESCGTMSQETGLLELAIRLPVCKHVVGSGCIAKWLHTNNNCPFCRYVLFSTQSHPHLENRDMEGQIDHVQINQARTVRGQLSSAPISVVTEFFEEMRQEYHYYCSELDLPPSVASIATRLFANLMDSASSRVVIRGHSDHFVVALSIYIASHLTRHARTPAQISQAMGDIDSHSIRATYELLSDLDGIIDDGIRNDLDEFFGIQILVWPPRGNDSAARESALREVFIHCVDCCSMLDLPVRFRVTATMLARIMWYMAPFHGIDPALPTFAAACVYMAVHLLGSFRLLSQISQVARVSELGVAQIYRRMYVEREYIAVHRLTLGIGNSDQFERAWARLPRP